MNKNTFIKKFLETYVNTTTNHPDESYDHIDFGWCFKKYADIK